MVATSTEMERLEFATRLRKCLVNVGISPESPAVLMAQFNRRYAGRPVSYQGVRKWLLGEAIPTQDKLRVLADWFKVPIDWLRFGGELTAAVHLSLNATGNVQELSETDRILLANFQRLDRRHQASVLLLLESLATAC